MSEDKFEEIDKKVKHLDSIIKNQEKNNKILLEKIEKLNPILKLNVSKVF